MARLVPAIYVFRISFKGVPMRKFVTIAVLIPLAIIIVMFAVANRETITVAFDPFDTAHPAYALKLPLFVLIFVLVGVGVVVGGIAAWLRQHKWRMRARRAEAEARELRARLDADGPKRNMPVSVGAPPFAVPPAA
jgi:uncharacterized integral membrane protein